MRRRLQDRRVSFHVSYLDIFMRKMDDEISRDITTTEREHGLKYVEGGSDCAPRNIPPALGGAGDFVPKPEWSPSVSPRAPPRRSPSEAPRAPPRKQRAARTTSAPPARPIPPCQTEDKEPTKKLPKRPPYNPLLNPFKDDMEEEELVEYKEKKSGIISFNAVQSWKERKCISNEGSMHPFAEHNNEKKKKISFIEYPENPNPFAGDTDEKVEDKKDDYDESFNPFAPPPPVFRKKIPQPTTPVPPPVAATSFTKTLGRFFLKRKDKKEARTSEKVIKWICIEPNKTEMAGYLYLKKGQRVKQTGPANTDGFAYGYTKKGILRTKVWGLFPLTNMHLLEYK